jgi:hypothetical protein
LPNPDCSDKSSKPRRYLEYKWIVWGISYCERKLKQRAAKYEKENAADRAARRTADATWAIFFLTLVIMIVGYLQWQSMMGQLDEMRSSSEDTKQIIATAKSQVIVMQNQLDEMKFEQRPWVYADIGIRRAIYRNQGGGFTIPIFFVLHNTGHLPASYVSPDIEAYIPAGVGSQSANERQQRRCAHAAQQTSASDQIGTTIFPGQTVNLETGVGIDADEVETARKVWLERTGKQMDILTIWVVGCIRYRSPDGDTHQTGTVFYLGMKNPAEMVFMHSQLTQPLLERRPS